MISPLTNEKKFGDVSNEDFTTLGVTVVQNSSDIAVNAAKPSSSQVDSQINTKNAAQNLQISLDYADQPTTYNKSEVYNKTESDASLALKGSAAGFATVTAYASGLPTTSTVNNLMDARFLLQDTQNFVTYLDRASGLTTTAAAATYAPQATTYSKTESDTLISAQATTNAATYATQASLGVVSTAAATNATNITATQVEVVLLQSAATANSAQGQTNTTTIAGVVAGSQALASADITGNAIIGGTLQAAGITSTGSFLGGSWAAFGSIPLNPVTGGLYAQQLSTTGNVTCAGSLFVGGVQVTPAGGASAGDVLKSTRTNLTTGNVTIPTNGSWQTVWTHNHTPSDAQSYLHITVAAVFKLSAQSGSSDGEWLISIEVGGTTCGGTVLVTEGNRETGSSSPLFAKYTNSSTNQVQISLKARQLYSADQQLVYNQPGASYLTNWVHVEEVRR